MSDDTNIVDLSKERERRDSKELNEDSNEFNPWQEMDSSINSEFTDHPRLPESPFLIMSEAVDYIHKESSRIRQWTMINKSLYRINLTMVATMFILTIFNFIMILILAN